MVSNVEGLSVSEAMIEAVAHESWYLCSTCNSHCVVLRVTVTTAYERSHLRMLNFNPKLRTNHQYYLMHQRGKISICNSGSEGRIFSENLQVLPRVTLLQLPVGMGVVIISVIFYRKTCNSRYSLMPATVLVTGGTGGRGGTRNICR